MIYVLKVIFTMYGDKALTSIYSHVMSLELRQTQKSFRITHVRSQEKNAS